MELHSLLVNMLIINIVLYVFILLLFIYCRDRIIKRKLNMYQLSKKDKGVLEIRFLTWIGTYELFILVFNIVPLIAMNLVS